jgi:hypothetical protein
MLEPRPGLFVIVPGEELPNQQEQGVATMLTFDPFADPEPDELEAPWFIHFHDERIIDANVNPRLRRWIQITTSQDKGEGTMINSSGPLFVDDPQLDRQYKILEYLVSIHNAKVVPKPRNVNQERDGTGKFVRKAPQNP